MRVFSQVFMHRLLVFLLLFGTLAASGTAWAQSARSRLVVVLSGELSGVYYPVGSALASLFVQKLPNTTVVLQVTRGAVNNLELLQSGRGTVGPALADTVLAAWKGIPASGFSRPAEKLRALAPLHDTYLHVVASRRSGVRIVADMKGRRIAVGPQGSGTELNARALLRALGLTYNDFSRVEFVSFNQAVDLMLNDQIDVMIQSSGLGAPSIQRLVAGTEVFFLAVPELIIDRMGSRVYTVSAIPAQSYGQQHVMVPTVSIPNILMTHADVSADLVYDLTRAFHQGLESLRKAHPATAGMPPGIQLTDLPVPWHPGALRYYREIGVLD